MAVAISRTSVHVESLLDERGLDEALCADARRGLLRPGRKELSPIWLYDEHGSRLFDEITRLASYYPTRCERAILERRAVEVASVVAPQTLVELGSGSAEKTDRLLEPCIEAGLARYVPLDLSAEVLHASVERIAAARPGLDVRGLVGDFEQLDALECSGRTLVAFLGGTVGNFPPSARARFLYQLRRRLDVGGALLVGVDLVKEPARLELAYDEPEGVTAAFNLNVLAVLNRVLDADFDRMRFAHVARWNPQREWVEMALSARIEHDVHLRRLGTTIRFAAAEEIRTEISAKFRRSGFERELRAAGFAPSRWWLDPTLSYALSLSLVDPRPEGANR